MIDVYCISYTYPHTHQPVLVDFSVCFQPGMVTAIVGSNGCGKTTLSKLLVGLLRPDRGQILIDGVDIAQLSLFQIGQKIGYIWQNPNRQLFSAIAMEEIAFGLRKQGLSPQQIQMKVDYWLNFFHLNHIKEALPLRLSLGEKQRLALAAVLSLDPPYLLLDEPTGGLDRRCRRELGELLGRLAKEQGRGVIVISHEADFLTQYAQREVSLI